MLHAVDDDPSLAQRLSTFQLRPVPVRTTTGRSGNHTSNARLHDGIGAFGTGALGGIECPADQGRPRIEDGVQFRMHRVIGAILCVCQPFGRVLDPFREARKAKRELALVGRDDARPNPSVNDPIAKAFRPGPRKASKAHEALVPFGHE